MEMLDYFIEPGSGVHFGFLAIDFRVLVVLERSIQAFATRLSVMPKISKKAIQKGLASLSSLAASVQVRLKFSARDLISFQLKGMAGSPFFVG